MRIDYADLIVPDDEIPSPKKNQKQAADLRRYVINRKSPDWVACGLSYAAIWTWDVLATHWRFAQRRGHKSMALNAKIKREIGMSDHRYRRKVLDELAAFGLITFEAGRGRLTRITYVDASGSAPVPDRNGGEQGRAGLQVSQGEN